MVHALQPMVSTWHPTYVLLTLALARAPDTLLATQLLYSACYIAVHVCRGQVEAAGAQVARHQPGQVFHWGCLPVSW